MWCGEVAVHNLLHSSSKAEIPSLSSESWSYSPCTRTISNHTSRLAADSVNTHLLRCALCFPQVLSIPPSFSPSIVFLSSPLCFGWKRAWWQRKKVREVSSACWKPLRRSSVSGETAGCSKCVEHCSLTEEAQPPRTARAFFIGCLHQTGSAA